MLNKMWLKAEIDKCPVCKCYHEKTNPETPFLHNLNLCERCKDIQKMYKRWNTNKE